MATIAVRGETHVTGIAPQFLVDDLERAIGYYREKLGFELDFVYESFYAAVRRDGFSIHLKHASKLAAERDRRRQMNTWTRTFPSRASGLYLANCKSAART